jgi:predicted lipid-binding transport protein (Tim44 family)
MKKFFSIIIAAFSLSLVVVDADAASRRFGGGGNVGKQRSDVTQQQAAPKAPAQQQNQAAPATPAQQPSGMSKWLGPLAGLAIGAGLASLFFNNGMGGALAGMLMVGLLVAAAIFAVRYFMRGRTGHQQQPLQYAGAGADTAGPVTPPTALPGGAGSQSIAATVGGATALAAAPAWPAGFDAAAFARQAKLNFVNMQAANDKRDLSTMRDVLTPEMYREIEANLRSEWGTPQKTEVVTLEAEVINVVTEGDLYVVSVRFTGMIREQDAQPEAFSEIWHLEKPVNGRSGWVVSGIQQS